MESVGNFFNFIGHYIDFSNWLIKEFWNLTHYLKLDVSQFTNEYVLVKHVFGLLENKTHEEIQLDIDPLKSYTDEIINLKENNDKLVEKNKKKKKKIETLQNIFKDVCQKEKQHIVELEEKKECINEYNMLTQINEKQKNDILFMHEQINKLNLENKGFENEIIDLNKTIDHYSKVINNKDLEINKLQVTINESDLDIRTLK